MFSESVVSECNVTKCDISYCTGTNCSQCVDGYSLLGGLCHECHLYCLWCSEGQCHKCYPPGCSTDFCKHTNCTSRCNANAKCSGCPDGFYQNINHCYRCDHANCKCSSKGNCIECLPGYYGTSNFCVNECPENCTTCKNTNECVECLAGKYGVKCESDCVSTCQNGTCDKETGTCPGQCPERYFYDTDTTCKPCPVRCKACNNYNECTNCNMTYYWGPVCQWDCTGCYSQCDKINGCPTGCDDIYFQIFNRIRGGYECKHCPDGCSTCHNLTQCTSCNDRNWGRLCQHSCASCSGNCDVITWCEGKCTLGHYPVQIDTGSECQPCSARCEYCVDSSTCRACEDGYYVAIKNCSVCPFDCKGDKCDPSNGTCTNGCVSGQTGFHCDGKCPVHCVECDQFNSSNCFSCKSEFYGDSCEHSCSRNCKPDNGLNKCHKDDGSCLHGCEKGHWTETYTVACAEGCADPLCNETTGVCLHGCKPNYYGQLCSTQCSHHCLNVSYSNRICNETSGDCLGPCLIGWYGGDCSLQCSNGCYQSRCFQTNGTCELECVDGSTDERCSEEGKFQLQTYI